MWKPPFHQLQLPSCCREGCHLYSSAWFALSPRNTGAKLGRACMHVANLWISTVKSNRAMNRATNQATNRATNRATNWATNQAMNQATNRAPDLWIELWTELWTECIALQSHRRQLWLWQLICKAVVWSSVKGLSLRGNPLRLYKH